MAKVLKSEARKLLKLRDTAKKADTEAKRAKDARNAQERVVSDLLEDQDVKTTTIDLGEPYGEWKVGRRKKIFSRVFDLDKLLEALRAEGREEEAIKHDVRKAPLNELVRERLETGEPLPDGLDFSETPYIQMSKSK